MIDYEKFQKSLRQLELQYENFENSGERENLSKLDREALSESVIQRFETCYDTLWKHLKRYLIEELGLPEIPNSPKPIFRLADQNQLLAAPVDRWLAYADARIATTHDYSGEKARECLNLVGDFINDATALYQMLSANDK